MWQAMEDPPVDDADDHESLVIEIASDEEDCPEFLSITHNQPHYRVYASFSR